MPSGSAMSTRDDHRRERQLGGRRHALENLLRHRLIVPQRRAEVAAHQPAAGTTRTARAAADRGRAAARSCATSSGDAPSPSIACAGSPGMRWISEKTSVATPSRTGIVSSSRRMRYLSIEMKALHQFRETLAAEPERGRRLAAMAGRARERRAHESLFELEPRALERLVRRQLRRARDRRRQLRRADDAARRNRDDERRQHVLKLANVAGPIIPRERAKARSGRAPLCCRCAPPTAARSARPAAECPRRARAAAAR